MTTSTLSTGWLASRGRAASAQTLIDLPNNMAWSLVPRRGGIEIRCERGAVWVTVEGDPEDHVLVAPAAFSIRSRRRVAALALEAARIAVGRI